MRLLSEVAYSLPDLSDFLLCIPHPMGQFRFDPSRLLSDLIRLKSLPCHVAIFSAPSGFAGMRKWEHLCSGWAAIPDAWCMTAGPRPVRTEVLISNSLRMHSFKDVSARSVSVLRLAPGAEEGICHQMRRDNCTVRWQVTKVIGYHCNCAYGDAGQGSHQARTFTP